MDLTPRWVTDFITCCFFVFFPGIQILRIQQHVVNSQFFHLQGESVCVYVALTLLYYIHVYTQSDLLEICYSVYIMYVSRNNPRNLCYSICFLLLQVKFLREAVHKLRVHSFSVVIS